MGIFDFLKGKKGGGGGETRTEVVEFTVGPDVRSVHDDGVSAIDAALNGVGSGELLHMLDPRRINAFTSGGPPVWSVAFVPVGEDQLFVTYGNSDRVDPSREGKSFELSILVPARCAGMWPGMLLRELCKYMLTTGRDLKVGDFIPVFPPPHMLPPSGSGPRQREMESVFLVRDPLLPEIQTPRGPIEVRRVVGMYADERASMEVWSVDGLARTIGAFAKRLETDLDRGSLAKLPEFQAAMDAGSRSEGSQFGFVAVDGVDWEPTEDGARITFPGGAEAKRIHRMIQARLPFGRHLLVHDSDPEQRLAVALESGPFSVGQDGPEVLIVTLPEGDPRLRAFENPGDEPIVWNLVVS